MQISITLDPRELVTVDSEGGDEYVIGLGVESNVYLSKAQLRTIRNESNDFFGDVEEDC